MKTRLLCISLSAVLLAGCSNLIEAITPYQLEIPQGNRITPEQIARLKAGMTRTQVSQLLGTPLLTDPFHANRWDYLRQDRIDGEQQNRRVLTVYFENDKVSRWEGEASSDSALAPK